jgi:4-hydroxyphenylpyruvate dioxygenase
MDFHHVHFYVDDALAWRDWYVQTLNFVPVGTDVAAADRTVWLQQGDIRVRLSSPGSADSPVAIYLRHRPAGIVDVAFTVPCLASALEALLRRGAQLQRPIQSGYWGTQQQRWCQVAGWGGLVHTLVESPPSPIPKSTTAPLPSLLEASLLEAPLLEAIDHVVLNVPRGQLAAAASWYCQIWGFEPRQVFQIQTEASGLCSQVLVHPQGTAQLPINEPSTGNSQIQEFLDLNRGPGIQHVALRSRQLTQAITTLRPRGLKLLPVPAAYYAQLPQRPGYRLETVDWRTIAERQILVDWLADLPESMILQTFTEPIFAEPTFFFELIERRRYLAQGSLKTATGFGEGNFRALFEAIEREQRQRGSLSLAEKATDEPEQDKGDDSCDRTGWSCRQPHPLRRQQTDNRKAQQ